MSTVEVIKRTRLTNTDLQKAGVSAQQVIESPEMKRIDHNGKEYTTITEIPGTPLPELEILKQKLAQAEAALAKATAPKQKAFSSVSYLFTLLPDYVNKEGLLPTLDKPTAEILQKKVTDRQKELGIDKAYKLISVYTDYRFFAMTLNAISTRFYLNIKTGKEKETITEIPGTE